MEEETGSRGRGTAVDPDGQPDATVSGNPSSPSYSDAHGRGVPLTARRRREPRSRRDRDRRGHRHRPGDGPRARPDRGARRDLRPAAGADRGHASRAGGRRPRRARDDLRRPGARPGRGVPGRRRGAVRDDGRPHQQRRRAVRRAPRADRAEGIACRASAQRRRAVAPDESGGRAVDDPATGAASCASSDSAPGVASRSWRIPRRRAPPWRTWPRRSRSSGRSTGSGRRASLRGSSRRRGCCSTEARSWSTSTRRRCPCDEPAGRRKWRPRSRSSRATARGYLTGTTVVVDGGADAWGIGAPPPPLE